MKRIKIILWVVLYSQICLALPTKEAKIKGVHNTAEDSLTLHIQTHNSEHRLNLKKPESSIFSNNFKLHIAKKDADGKTVFLDQTPSRHELLEIQRRIYIDPESDSALHVHHSNGEFRINGHFSGHSISHGLNGQHFVAAIPGRKSQLNDYIDPHRKIAPAAVRNTKVEAEEEPIFVTPELGVVFDYNNYETFGGNHTEMTNYLSLFINGVNNRYANIPNPKIFFKITGLLVISSIEDQPFITSSEIPGGSDGHDLSKMLNEYTAWVNNDAREYFPVHDMAPMFTSVHLQSLDENGNWVDGVAGLATVGDACWESSTSIILDAGANYAGINNLAHELAHSLGSFHDGAPGAEECPSSDGYIMSYEGDGKESNFYFSACSIAAMKKFITSDDGACLRNFQSEETWETPSGNPGDYISLNTQCQRALNNPTAFADPSIADDDICTNLVCIGSDETGIVSSYYQGRMPADGSYCGTSGSCFNGKCFVETDMNTQCQTATGKTNAYADSTQTPDSLCANLVCKYPGGGITNTKTPAINYSPCGRQGRCIENSCVEPPRSSMSEQCAKSLFKPDAFADPDKTPDELCAQLECRYIEDGIEYARTTYRPAADFTPCGQDGYCFSGKCTGDKSKP